VRANYIHYASPQFHLLSEKQLEELHLATLQILERAGVAFECQEAIELLGDAGADVSDHNRVKIPSHLVEEALRTTPKTITIYTRDGEPAMVLNGMTGSHFIGGSDLPTYLDPFTGKGRPCYVEDIAANSRVIDALPNIEGVMTGGCYPTLPGTIGDRISLLQHILNSSKPIACSMVSAQSLREMIELCSIVSGSEEQLRRKPFFIGSSEPVTPLTQGKDPMEQSLLCAEKGIPNYPYSMPMAGATTPATWPAVLVIPNAEFLSQLVPIQLKRPGAPVIYGSIPNIMDLRTTIFPYGAPEMSLLVAAMTELAHYYGLPMLGTAGCTDSDVIDAQTATEATYQILMTALSGADFVHDVGLMNHGLMISPELMVLSNEIVDMAKVAMGGIEINEDTLPLDLIERVGPRGNFLSEKHTLKHFRKFWVPTIFDRSAVKTVSTRRSAQLLREKTIGIIEKHQPKPLPDDMLKELRKVEARWLRRLGLKTYPKRPS
jgi:trimethylamine--corrinoid protein Co-methyltransferase